MSETLQSLPLHFVELDERRHLKPLQHDELAAASLHRVVDSRRQELDAIADASEGIATDRATDFLTNLGLEVSGSKLIAPGSRGQVARLLSGRESEDQHGVFDPLLDRAIVFRDSKLEQDNGSLLSEVILVHELAHSSAKERHAMVSGRSVFRSRDGFIVANPSTMEMRGTMFEEAFAEHLAGQYLSEVTGSPNGFFGGDTPKVKMITINGYECPIFANYLFRNSARSSGLGLSMAGIAASGLDILLKHDPSLMQTMITARHGGADGLRDFRQSVDAISPGLYRELLEVPYSTAGFAKGLNEINQRLGFKS